MPSRAQLLWNESHRRFRRGLAAALCVLVAVAALLSGRSYLWCLALERPMEACCCAPSQPGLATSDEQATVRASCCDARTIAALPRCEGARFETAIVPVANVSTASDSVACSLVMR